VVKWVIEVEGLVKKFNGRSVLHDVTFHVRRGAVFGLLGPNGAGKTTTIRILLGLLAPTSGKALVLGGRPSENRELRNRVGVVLESDGLFSKLTAFENLDFYARVYGLKSRVEREKKIKELLELVGLYEVRGLKVGYFSKGMRRRLALARAIIRNPEVLFLDEPTSGLDVEARVIVRDLVTKLSRREGVTILYASHDLEEVEKVCSKVALLVKGRVIACDAIENLLIKSSEQLVEVYFVNGSDALRAIERLKELDYVLECKRNDERVAVLVSGDPSRLLSDLVGMGFKVVEARRIRKSLEKMYLELVRGMGE